MRQFSHGVCISLGLPCVGISALYSSIIYLSQLTLRKGLDNQQAQDSLYTWRTKPRIRLRKWRQRRSTSVQRWVLGRTADSNVWSVSHTAVVVVGVIVDRESYHHPTQPLSIAAQPGHWWAPLFETGSVCVFSFLPFHWFLQPTTTDRFALLDPIPLQQSTWINSANVRFSYLYLQRSLYHTLIYNCLGNCSSQTEVFPDGKNRNRLVIDKQDT